MLTLLLLLALTALGQYPDIIYDSTITFGQCLRDSDCTIYTLTNASLISLGLFCNPATSRCEIADGQAFGPAFSQTCAGVSISIIRYPSYARSIDVGFTEAFMADGILVATMSFPTATFEGVLRLYCISLSLSTPQVQTLFSSRNLTYGPVLEEQYVNWPTTQYVYRNLFGSVDAACAPYFAYFDLSGCTVIQHSPEDLPCIRADADYPDYFGPPNLIPVPSVPHPAYLVVPNVITYTNPSQRIARFQLASAQWAAFAFNFELTVNTGYRCIFGQTLDMTGRVLASAVNTELLDSGPGISFPLTSLNVFPANETASHLGGFVVVQLGVGYCINQMVTLLNVTTNTTYMALQRYVLQDQLGVYEGFMGQRIVLDLNIDLAPGRPLFIPGFQTARMYTRLNVAQFNTYKVKIGQIDPFGFTFPHSFVNLTTNPVISIISNLTAQVTNDYSFCGTNNPAGGQIRYDYTAFPTAGRADLYLVSINLADPGLAETDLTPVFAIAVPGFFTVTQWGFYCLDLRMNLVDGLGYRTVLRTCFQVGQLAATITQLRSYFVSVTTFDNPFPQTPFSGYGENVNTQIYVGLPPFLVLPVMGSYFPRVRVYRFSADAFDEAQLQTYGGNGEVDIYPDVFGEIPIATAYTLLASSPNYTVYGLAHSNFNRYTYDIIAYNGAAEAMSEAVLVQMEIVLPADDLDIVSPGPGIGIGSLDYYTGPPHAEVIDYQCDVPAALTLISMPRLQASITVTQPVCQNNLAAVVGYAVGGFCMPVINPYLNMVNGNSAPYREPCTYYLDFYNVNDPANPLFLYGAQNGYLYAAPPNTNLELVVTDLMGNTARIFFNARSLVPPNSTFITFLPPVPACTVVNGTTTQAVTYEFVLGGIINTIVFNGTANVTIDAIFGWQPLNVLANALYDPNSPFFDLPQYCTLLNNMTAFQVFSLCFNASLISQPECAGCTRLPVGYDGANGNILTATQDGWWEAYAWIPSTFFNTHTGRTTYCRYALSLHAALPLPMTLLITSLRRITVGGAQCSGANCFAADFAIAMDPLYAPTYISMVQFTQSPPMSTLICNIFDPMYNTAVSPPPLTCAPFIDPITFVRTQSRGVAIETTYLITLSLDDLFCPVEVTYIPSATGPLIQLAVTTRSICTSPTGTAVLYAVYNDPSQPAGTTADVCMFFVGYTTAFFYFHLPMNSANPTALPFSPDFFVSVNVTRFTGITAGLHTIVVYDACVGGTGCGPSVDCSSPFLINQMTLQVAPPLNFQVFQFSVTQFALPGGGLVISLDNRTDARCYGDTYELIFSAFDDLGEADQVYGPYCWQFFEPFSNSVIQQSAPCLVGGQTIISPLDVIGFKVKLFSITIHIPTGKAFGFRQSGNYTLVLTDSGSGCVQTFTVFINMVNPFDIVLSPVNSMCAYYKGAIIRSFYGGTPFQPGQLYDQSYYPAGYLDENFVDLSEYITYWKTPFTAGLFVRTRLPTRVFPGNYTVMLVDANNCNATASVTVASPPPFTISGPTSNAACQSQSSAVFDITVKGGVGPPYFTLEDLTTIVPGENITFDFVSAFGQTACFTIEDSVGCINPNPTCITVPVPGAIDVNIAVNDSCPFQPTGTVVATSNNNISGSVTCAWESSGSTFGAAGSCTQSQIPGGVEVTVTLTNLIGCTGQAVASVGARPPMIITQIARSTGGTFGGLPCIDTANITVFGGRYGPPYQASLVLDTSGAVLTYDNNHTFTITQVCRSIQYVLAVKDADGMCVQTFFSNDPLFGFGGTGEPEDFPTGLPPFIMPTNGGSFGSAFVYSPQENPPPRKEHSAVAEFWPVFLILALFFVPLFIFMLYLGFRRSS